MIKLLVVSTSTNSDDGLGVSRPTTGLTFFTSNGTRRGVVLPYGFEPVPGEGVREGHVLLTRAVPKPDLMVARPYVIRIAWLEVKTLRVRHLGSVIGAYRVVGLNCCNVANATAVGFAGPPTLSQRAMHRIAVNPRSGHLFEQRAPDFADNLVFSPFLSHLACQESAVTREP